MFSQEELEENIKDLFEKIGVDVDDNTVYELALQYSTPDIAVETYLKMRSPTKRRRVLIPTELEDLPEDSVAVSLWMMGFEINEVLKAAKRCSTTEAGVAYLLHSITEAPIIKCSTCLDVHSMENMVTLSCEPIPHRFCVDCFSSYCRLKINEAQVCPDSFYCPFIDCKTPITVEEVRAHVSEVDFLKYERFLLKKVCEKNRWRACPRCDWFADIDQSEEDVDVWKAVKCFQCSHKFCGRCGEKPHKAQDDQDLSCDKYAAWLAENSSADKTFEELLSNSSWKKCPSCSSVTALDGGCKFIHCICGTNFCYLCGIPLKESQHYNHYRNGPGCTGPYGNGCLGASDIIA